MQSTPTGGLKDLEAVRGEPEPTVEQGPGFFQRVGRGLDKGVGFPAGGGNGVGNWANSALCSRVGPVGGGNARLGLSPALPPAFGGTSPGKYAHRKPSASHHATGFA